MQPLGYDLPMTVLDQLRESVREIGIKEIARRSGLAASTVSRMSSCQINPSFKVIEKISAALGLRLNLQIDREGSSLSKLIFAKRVLSEMKDELKRNGVRHAVIFGSVAREENRPDSDIDIYLDFGDIKPSAANLLRAEGKILDAFGRQKTDIVSWLHSSRGKRLKQRIDKDGVRVF
jgi:predicted nucleotidyltransferase